MRTGFSYHAEISAGEKKLVRRELPIESLVAFGDDFVEWNIPGVRGDLRDLLALE